ncbi:histidine--tRNA ligase [Paenibacillus sp. MDMC362]|uniref:histidine--tRNA ligase n=1 Tax=Paenibacillus sp. MDMC362 TaxID=2977365 RepID=UPI000DC361D8|nr:histidine--tRNA ligase [Paenibacillus sp. MDMC362]RAR45859.1 histidine--tRNA ligase [Paenibacillus sp. MDMC362]
MQNVKGTYDYFGQEQAIRRKVQSTLREVFECYDYAEMETTILNESELLSSKYAGGEEILKEMYQLTDQGTRRLGLRYDLTIPFAKVIALNPAISQPFKRYEMGKVFRDGPVKRGRLREFLQCDVDVVGISGPEAEVELMQLAAEVFRRLEIPIMLRWNNRSFLGEILGAMGVPEEMKPSVMLTLDKLDKIGKEGVRQELVSKVLASEICRQILDFVDLKEPTLAQITSTYNLDNECGAREVRILQNMLQRVGLQNICVFDPFLSRGLSFYTGTVYEIFDASQGFRSSLGGGGRYDAIIGQLVGREDIVYPTVGLSFGMESIMEMIRNRPIETNKPLVVIILIGETIPEGLTAAAALRNRGIHTRLADNRRKLKKTLASVSAEGIPYAILIGEDEAAAGMVRLKKMTEGKELTLTLQKAVELIIQSCE